MLCLFSVHSLFNSISKRFKPILVDLISLVGHTELHSTLEPLQIISQQTYVCFTRLKLESSDVSCLMFLCGRNGFVFLLALSFELPPKALKQYSTTELDKSSHS